MKKKAIGLFIFLLGFSAAFAYLYQKQELNTSLASKQVWVENNPLIQPENANALEVFVKIAEKFIPTVVNINTSQTVKVAPFQGFEDDFFRKFFDDFFGPQQMPRRKREDKQRSLGSGFILSKDGYIITNNHVVEHAEEIKVKLTDTAKESFDAKVIGRDARTDVALLKINPKGDLPIAPLGNSDTVRVGEWVAAIGHPFGYGHTVSKGIVSAKERLFGDGISHPYNDYLQTDASINLGNSGGPLINTRGEVIGINVATDARAQGIIGFAIPINVAKNLIPQLMESGHAIRGFIGIQWFELTDDIREHLKISKDQEGVVVAEVIKGEPADLAGLKVYDVIVEFNGAKVNNPRDLLREVAKAPVGKAASIKVIREGKTKTLSLKPVERKEEAQEELKQKETEKQKDQKNKISLGIEVSDLKKYPEYRDKIDVSEGVIVMNIVSGSSADKAGFEKGDVIVEMNRQKIKDSNDFFKVASDLKKGVSYLFRIYRNQSYQLLIVKIE